MTQYLYRIQPACVIMQDDPVVKRGVMRAERFPYRIAWWAAPEGMRDGAV
jgi:hypothetical protein